MSDKTKKLPDSEIFARIMENLDKLRIDILRLYLGDKPAVKSGAIEIPDKPSQREPDEKEFG